MAKLSKTKLCIFIVISLLLTLLMLFIYLIKEWVRISMEYKQGWNSTHMLMNESLSVSHPGLKEDEMLVYRGYREAYTYLYEEGTRERKWEEDFLNFANTLLNPYSGHPYLVDREITSASHAISVDVESKLVRVFDEKKKEQFLQGIHFAIHAIPNSTDIELLYMCRELLCLLEDVHTYLYPPFPYLENVESIIFPFRLRYMENEAGERGYYCVSSLLPGENILNGKLVSVNGFPIETVYERLSRIRVCDAGEYRVGQLIESFLYYEDLAYLRIVEDGESRFTFVLPNGKEKTVTVCSVPADLADSLYTSREKLQEDFWYEVRKEDKMIYARVSRCSPTVSYEVDGVGTGLTQARYWEEIADACKNNPKFKLVIDFRGNGGGGVWLTLQELRRIEKAGVKVYVIVDEFVASAASVMALAFDGYIENCTIVGSSTLQGGAFLYSTGNPGFTFHYFPEVGARVSSSRSVVLENRQERTIIPDITIYQKIEDAVQGKDTILEFIKNDAI